jgi:carboxymethylenebutenolidase
MSRSSALVAALGMALAASAQAPASGPAEHADHAMMSSGIGAHVVMADTMLPAGAADAAARLAASPRHREWVMIPAGGTDSVGAWVFYPERRTKAPVVVVIHEIFGMSTWVRGVGDQLAAQGFIAIVPDLLTGKNIPNGPDGANADSAVVAIRTLKPEDVQRRLIAAGNYGMKLPAALPRYGIVGFCWGGSASFAHAAVSPSVLAAVVYYGASPDSTLIGKVHAPVLGLYGGEDMRVDAMIPPADSALRAMKKTYEHYVFAGAGHGFARDQTGKNGANMAAIQEAWPKTIAWFRKYLEQ